MGAPFFASMNCCRSKLKMGQRRYLSYLSYFICIYYVSTGPGRARAQILLYISSRKNETKRGRRGPRFEKCGKQMTI